MAQLLNTARVDATYRGYSVFDDAELTIELSAVSITKSANMMIWAGGELTYGIEVTNIDTEDSRDPVTGLTIADLIDPMIARFIDTSLTVTIDGLPFTDPVHDYVPETGVLTIELDELTAGQVAIISFRIEKITP